MGFAFSVSANQGGIMEKTVIYYYSATGNSLVAARMIAERLGNAELISMKKTTGPVSPGNASRIGLVFPVHIFGVPVAVADFIERLSVPADAFIFAVATNGGMACATLKQMEQLMERRSMKLSAGFELKMVNNCTAVGEAPALDKQKYLLQNSVKRINRICDAIEKRTKRIYAGIPVVNWIFSTKLYGNALPKIPGMDKTYVAQENCNGCGNCQKVCQAKNIVMENGRPVWQHHCEACYACLQWCTKEAIQFGEKTVGRRRYRHPEVRLNDIAVNAG
jgi:flavodoxin/NAD-dependent dihydropyrimidine dehydrogenase PreA subunit